MISALFGLVLVVVTALRVTLGCGRRGPMTWKGLRGAVTGYRTTRRRATKSLDSAAAAAGVGGGRPTWTGRPRRRDRQEAR